MKSIFKDALLLYRNKGSDGVAQVNSDLKKILLKLAKGVTKITDNKVTEEIKEVYSEEVDYMYSEYAPKVYQRRYDNGFGGENNWETSVDLKNNSIEFELVNETETYNASNYTLDELIEKGMGYLPKPRPVYERVDERLKNEQVVENTLKSELKKIGYEFK